MNKTENLNIRTDKELINNYRIFCKENNFKISKRIREFMLMDLKINNHASNK